MTEWYLTKRLGKLVPSDPKTEEMFNALKLGETIRASVTKPRNPGHHRKLWALLAKCVEAGAPFDSAEALLFYLKVRAGYCDLIEGTRGHKYPMPKSISFAAMDQESFSRLYDHFVSIILHEVLPGVTKAELQEEIQRMLEVAA